MRTKRTKAIIKDAAAAIDAMGGNSKVANWLSVEIGMPAEPNTISGWRKRGISRNFAVHFYAELVVRKGYTLAPAVFGLTSWDHVLMPDKRGRNKLKRLASPSNMAGV